MNVQRRWEKCERKRRKERAKARGITPTKEQYVYCVRTTVVAFFPWCYDMAVPGLVSNADQVWFASSQLADLMVQYDLREGGRPEVTRLKYRKCQVCGMCKLNLLADERRRLDESAIDGREMPCGPECIGRSRQRKGLGWQGQKENADRQSATARRLPQ